MFGPLSPRAKPQKPPPPDSFHSSGQVSLPTPLSQIPHPLRRRPPRRDPRPSGTRRSLPPSFLPWIYPASVQPMGPGIRSGRRTRINISVMGSRPNGSPASLGYCERPICRGAPVFFLCSRAVDAIRWSAGGVASQRALCPRSGMIADVGFSDVGAGSFCCVSYLAVRLD